MQASAEGDVAPRARAHAVGRTPERPRVARSSGGSPGQECLLAGNPRCSSSQMVQMLERMQKLMLHNCDTCTLTSYDRAETATGASGIGRNS